MNTLLLSNAIMRGDYFMLHVDIQKKLNHFDLAVTFKIENEIISLLGPSGSGKSTILNCVAGLTKPNSGLIKLHNQTLFKGHKEIIPTPKRNIGYLFQDYALFPHMTVS